MADFLGSEGDTEEEQGWKPAQLAVWDVLWRDGDRIPRLAVHNVVPREGLVSDISARQKSTRLPMLTFGMNPISLPFIVYSGERLSEMSSCSTPALRLSTVD